MRENLSDFSWVITDKVRKPNLDTDDFKQTEFRSMRTISNLMIQIENFKTKRWQPVLYRSKLRFKTFMPWAARSRLQGLSDDILSSFGLQFSLTVISFIICHNHKPFNAFHKIHVSPVLSLNVNSNTLFPWTVLPFHKLWHHLVKLPVGQTGFCV